MGPTSSALRAALSVAAAILALCPPASGAGEKYPYNLGTGFTHCSGHYELGYRFRCDGYGVIVRRLGCIFTTNEAKTVTLWDDAGAAIRSVSVSYPGSSTWGFVTLPGPFELTPGAYYRISVWGPNYFADKANGYYSGWWWYWIQTWWGFGDPNVAYISAYYKSDGSPGFPTSNLGMEWLYGFPDFGYHFAPMTLSVPLSSDTGEYTVSWSACPGATGYELEENADASFVSTTQRRFLPISSGSTTTFAVGSAGDTPPGPKPIGTVLYYRIRAHFSGTAGADWSGWKKAGNGCVTGRVFVPEFSTTGSFIVSWVQFPSAPSGYRVEEAPEVNGAVTWPGSTFYTTTAVYYAIAGKPSGIWWYRVCPVGDTAFIYSLNGCRIGAPESPPSIEVPLRSATGRYKVEWGSVVGATRYELQESSLELASTPYRVYYGTGTAYTVTGKTSGTYSYRVRAENGAGFSGWTYSDNGCVMVPPEPPDRLTVDPVSRDGSIAISWSLADGADTYDLEEDTSSVFDSPAAMYAGAGSSFEVKGKSSGTFFYRVRSVNGAGAGRWRMAANGCQIAPPYPPTAFAVPATSTTGAVPLSWTAMDGALAYRLEMDPDPLFSAPVLLYEGPEPAFCARGIPDGTYSFHVRAGNGAGSSGWTSGSGPCTLSRSLPSAPGALTIPMSSSTGAYTVSWGAAIGAESYELEEAPDADFAGSRPVAVLAGTHLAVAGQADGTWYYRVRAVNPSGRSGWTEGSDGCVVWVTTPSLRIAPGPFNPRPTKEAAGASNVVLLQIEAAADAGHPIRLLTLRVTASGSGDDFLDMTDVALWRDADGDGATGTDDTRVNAAPARFTADNGQLLVDLSGEPVLQPGGTARYLLAAAFRTGIAAGSTFAVSLTPSADVTAEVALVATPVTPAVTDPAVAGATKTIAGQECGSLQVFPGGRSPAAAAYSSPAGRLPALQFVLQASSVEEIRVTRLQFALSGIRTSAPHFARLYRDDDGDGEALMSEVELVPARPVVPGDESAVFEGLSLGLAPGTRATLLLAFDVAEIQATFSAAIFDASDVEAAGATSLRGVVAVGAPVLGTTLTVAPVAKPAEDSGGCAAGGGGGGRGWMLLAIAVAALAGLRRTRSGVRG